MSYRRRAREQDSHWRDWHKQYADLIAAAGLPEIVVLDEAHWWDFLDHGFLDHHPDPAGFSTQELSVRQKAALLRLMLRWNVDTARSVLGLGLIEALLDAVEKAYDY